MKSQEKLVAKGVIDVDPLTRTSVPPTPAPGAALLSPSTSKRRHNNPLGVSLGLGLAADAGMWCMSIPVCEGRCSTQTY